MNIRSVARISVFMLFTSCFLVASPAYAQKFKIQKATPSWAEQGTGTEVDPLPVLIDGEGFDDVVQARFLVSGTKVTGGIKVESYSIEGPNQITAKVTVEGDAVLDYFDIEMTTSRGRRGKGNTLFRVVEEGGTNNDSGEQIDLKCSLESEFGDSILSDGRPGPDGNGTYVHAEEKVRCSTGGTVQPNLSGLTLDSREKGGPPRRKIDLAFGEFLVVGPGPDPVLIPTPPPYPLLGSIFVETDWKDMETVAMSVRSYEDGRPLNDYREEESAQDHIQSLDPDETYSIAMRIRIKSAKDNPYIISLADTDVPGDNFQGIWCDVDANQAAAITEWSQDVTVYLWPDDDLDGVADGYAVTTGAITSDEDSYTLAIPPTTNYESRTAAICSSVGPVDCGGPGGSDLCNFLGFVEVGFTWHAENK